LNPPQRVYSAFFLYAMAMGGLFPRLGELQQALGLNERALGLALIGTATGTLVSLSLASRWLDRIGHRRVLILGIPLVAAAFALASCAGSGLTLFLLLLPAGLCIGAVEIVINLEADRVEHQVGCRIMSRAHAFWSMGFFGAGLLGAVAPGGHGGVGRRRSAPAADRLRAGRAPARQPWRQAPPLGPTQPQHRDAGGRHTGGHAARRRGH
jgi:MFS family permease